MHGEGILADIGLAIVAATVLAYLARLLRQPLLLAYIGAGVVIGPSALRLVTNESLIKELSELGLAFLMFIVGLEVDLKKLVRSGRVGALVGTIQVVSCALITYATGRVLGFDGLAALYLGVALSFSSTMIVVKLLSDKSELDTVEGRLALGILLVQDVLAIVVLALQPNLQSPSLAPIGLSILSGFSLLGGALLVARFILPAVLGWAAKSPEIVLISAIAWCLLVGYGAILADFSIAMGALIAGVTLSALPYTLDVVAKIRSLRDFFVTLFFVALGMQLDVGTPRVLWAAAALSAVVVASRFVTVGPALYALGYGARVGLLASLALGQAGEFALVIATIGLGLGHIGQEITSIIALTLVITSTLTTYMVMSNHALARATVDLLRRVGLRDEAMGAKEERTTSAPPEIVVLGFHRVASSLVHELRSAERSPRFLIVDFSPEVYHRLRGTDVPVVYGDISHLDTLEHVGIEHARLVLSTVSDDFLRGTDNATLLKAVRRLNLSARVILCAETIERAREMYEAGADYVILPRVETARAFRAVLDAAERGELDNLRTRALVDLETRDEVLA